MCILKSELSSQKSLKLFFKLTVTETILMTKCEKYRGKNLPFLITVDGQFYFPVACTFLVTSHFCVLYWEFKNTISQPIWKFVTVQVLLLHSTSGCCYAIISYFSKLECHLCISSSCYRSIAVVNPAGNSVTASDCLLVATGECPTS